MYSDPIANIDALMMYWHNTAPKDVVLAVYTDQTKPCSDWEGPYLEEKTNICIDSGLTIFWSQLDQSHREKLAQAAFNKYGGLCAARNQEARNE